MINSFGKAPKNSLHLLLECWVDHLTSTVDVLAASVDVLQPVMYQLQDMNKGYAYTKIKWGMSSNGTISSNLMGAFPRLDSFVPGEWLFSHFASRAISGELDLDKSPRFAKHMAAHMFCAKAALNAFKLGHLYTPKEEEAQANSKTTKGPRVTRSKSDKRLASFVNQVSKSMTFRKKEEGETYDLKLKKQSDQVVLPKDNMELANTVHYLAENNLLMRVMVDVNGLKELHQDGTAPEDAFLERIWKLAGAKTKMDTLMDNPDETLLEEENASASDLTVTPTRPPKRKHLTESTSKSKRRRRSPETTSSPSTRSRSKRIKEKSKSTQMYMQTKQGTSHNNTVPIPGVRADDFDSD